MLKLNTPLILLIFILFLTSCSSSPPKNQGTIELQGVLTVVGNEPFTTYAIKDGEGRITRLKIDEKLSIKIEDWQGRRISVKGSRFTKMNELIVNSISLQTQGELDEK